MKIYKGRPAPLRLPPAQGATQRRRVEDPTATAADAAALAPQRSRGRCARISFAYWCVFSGAVGRIAGGGGR